MPDEDGEGSWLYLHHNFEKRENFAKGYKKTFQLSSCAFVGLFLEDSIPIACTHL